MNADLLLTLAILLLLAFIGLALLTRRRRAPGPRDREAAAAARREEAMQAERAEREASRPPLAIEPLAAAEAQRFRMEWQALQARFEAAPRTTLAEADLLARDVMLRRGFPMHDFEGRVDELLRDHARAVDHYRSAHATALRDQHAPVDIEALREALGDYRKLFVELLADAEPAAAPRRPLEERKPERGVRGILAPERALARDAALNQDRERRSERG